MTTPTNPYPSSTAWPPDFNGCTIVGRFTYLDGSPVAGATIQLSAVIAGGGTNLIDVTYKTQITARQLTITTGVDGRIRGVNGTATTEGVVIPASNDPDITPAFYYRCTLNWNGGRSFTFDAPVNGTVDLTAIPLTSGTTAGGVDTSGILVNLGAADRSELDTAAAQAAAATDRLTVTVVRMTQSGNTYVPAKYLADTSVYRIWDGDLNPLTVAGAVPGPNDEWNPVTAP